MYTANAFFEASMITNVSKVYTPEKWLHYYVVVAKVKLQLLYTVL